jgi:hypothetical protein
MRVPSAPSLALKRTWMGKINDERAQATLIPFSFLSLFLFSISFFFLSLSLAAVNLNQLFSIL